MIKHLVLLLLIQAAVYSQWLPDFRLTDDNESSEIPSIAAIETNIHIAYVEFDGNREIYYLRSTNSGQSWQSKLRLTNNSANSEAPSIAVSGVNVYIVWFDNRNGNYDIYYKFSTNNGVSWSSDINLVNNSANSYFPSISASGQIVNLAWYDYRHGDFNPEIYFKRSSNGGITWGSDVRLTTDPNEDKFPSIVVSGNTSEVVWVDSRHGDWEIYLRRSSNSGANWNADIRLTNNSSTQWRPKVSLSGQFIHVIWQDNRSGVGQTYYRRSTDGGNTLSPEINLSSSTASAKNTSIHSSGMIVHAVWDDNRSGNDDIIYRRSTDGGATWGNIIHLTTNGSSSIAPDVVTLGRTVHVSFMDFRHSNWELYYKRDTTGNVIGITNISTEIPMQFSLEQNYPNPFNPSTKINFKVAETEFVSLKVYDLLGREIETLASEILSPGTYEADFSGGSLASGIYYYRLTAGNFSETKTMILLK